MELAEDVAEEVLDLVPGVDAVGAVQHDDDVHVRGAPCQRVAGSEKSLVPNIMIISYFCRRAATLCSGGDGLPRLQVVADGGADAGAEHGRAALLRPQGGARLPGHDVHTQTRHDVHTQTKVSVV